ncbi:hypothetical protein HNQ69_000524 [Bartonella callosciuri]|uniref:Uncharacterized protein n=1 Tax=Bartonella callosciuri TaxID=686223 RepID=A0A840NTY2_9HYPH|nr:hypothetical protein [Bartonella callosciuri]
MAEHQYQYLRAIEVINLSTGEYYRLPEVIDNLNTDTEKAHQKNKPHSSSHGVLKNPEGFLSMLHNRFCFYPFALRRFFFRNNKEYKENHSHHQV